uniref:Thioredoxin domain-containing protein n=1 Tax=Cynoglossus semilaevis TaxID=244447 RepID=A0A3P8UKT9_CYNSE
FMHLAAYIVSVLLSDCLNYCLHPPIYPRDSREEGQIWAVDFYAPWCGPCQALIPEWRRMARLVSGQIQVGSMDCQRFQSFCQSQGVRAYPEIRLYSGNTRQPDKFM